MSPLKDNAKKCGCGGELRYSHQLPDGTQTMSCNKYAVCMTWEEQHNRISFLTRENSVLTAALQTIVNTNACDYEYRAWAKAALEKIKTF